MTNSQLAAMQDIVLDYLSNVEEVLAWLLGAEEHVADIVDDAALLETEFEAIKEMFDEHEDFMLELTEYQSKISDLLNEGQVLIDSSFCSNEEKNEVRAQRELLGSKWENLRSKSTEKQTQLHQTIMLLQVRQLRCCATYFTLHLLLVAAAKAIGQLKSVANHGRRSDQQFY